MRQGRVMASMRIYVNICVGCEFQFLLEHTTNIYDTYDIEDNTIMYATMYKWLNI